MKRSVLRPEAVLLVVVLFLALQLVTDLALGGARVDLTEGGLYTLTDGSKRIAASFDEPVRLEFFFSDSLGNEVRRLETYADRVRELLDEYVAASDGMLTLRVVDPAPFSEDEDLAMGAGLQGAPLNEAGDVLYFGLVVSDATGHRETIPFFDPRREEFLEYDVSQLLYKLAHPEKPVVGLLSSLPLAGGGEPPMMPGMPPQDSPPWMILQQIEQTFEVREVDPFADALPDDLDVLLLVHPQGLSQDMLWSIDQFVLRGGRALAFVDPHCEEQSVPSDPGNPLAGMGTPRASQLEPLLSAWGVAFDPDRVLADRAAAMQVNAGARGRPEVLDYVVFLEMGPDAMAPDEPVLTNLSALRFGVPGALAPQDGATTTFTPLVSTGDDAELLDAETVRFFPDPKKLLADYAPGGVPRVLAARVHGPAKSAFPEGRPSSADDASEDGAAPDAGSLSESTGDIHVIVVADADMLADHWWVRVQSLLGMQVAMPTADNADFVINALDSLGGSTDLVEVRGRGSFQRPFTRLEELRQEAEQRFLEKEQALQARLSETERRINELQRQRGDDASSLILTPEQEAEIERFEQQRLATRKELREVRHELRKDIETTQTTLAALNIGGVPLLLLAAALVRWFLKRN